MSSNSYGRSGALKTEFDSHLSIPIHKRAAAERRIKGIRPAIAAVIHQNSDIITAALKTQSEVGGKKHKIEDLTKIYQMEHNMYAINKNRKAARKSMMLPNLMDKITNKYKARIETNYVKTYHRRNQSTMGRPTMPRTTLPQSQKFSVLGMTGHINGRPSSGRKGLLATFSFKDNDQKFLDSIPNIN